MRDRQNSSPDGGCRFPSGDGQAPQHVDLLELALEDADVLVGIVSVMDIVRGFVESEAGRRPTA